MAGVTDRSSRDQGASAGPRTQGTGRGLAPSVIFASLSLIALFLALGLSTERLIYVFSDDAYYYFKVAANIVSGSGPTFDGMNQTNGFHPLWMMILLPVFSLFQGSADAPLRAIVVIQGLLSAGAAVLAWSVIRAYSDDVRSVLVAAAVALTLYSPILLMFNGLETALVVLGLFVLISLDSRLAFVSRAEPPPMTSRVLLGIVLGALVLARLDTAFLIMGLALWCVLDRGRVPLLKRIVGLFGTYWVTIAAFAAVLAPFFIWNLSQFGHLMPISGALKTTFPEPVFRYGFLLKQAPYTLATLLTGAALVHLWRRVETLGIGRHNLGLLTGLWVGCLLHLVWSTVFMGWATFQWHFAAHVPVVAVVLGLWAPLILGWLRTPALAGALAVAVAAFNGLVVYEKGNHHLSRYAAAGWVRSSTPEDTVFGLRDAGVFGYFSERAVMNLDGLINSYEYQESILGHELPAFFERRNLAVVVDTYVPCDYERYRISVESYPTQRDPGYEFLAARDAQIYMSEPISNRSLLEGGEETCIVMWDYGRVKLSPVEERASRSGH